VRDGCLGDRFGGECGDLRETVEPEKFSRRIAGFENTVGEKGKVVAGLELDRLRVVAGIGCKAERERSRQIEREAIAVGWQMAGVGENHLAARFKAGHEAGGEVSPGAAEQTLVEGIEQRSRVRSLIGTGTDGANEDGDQHGRRDAFARNIADDNEQFAARKRDDLVEVAADGERGAVGGLDRERGGGEGFGHENLLLQEACLLKILGYTLALQPLRDPGVDKAPRNLDGNNQYDERAGDVVQAEIEARREEDVGGQTEPRDHVMLKV